MRVLRWICDPDQLEALEGDLAELHRGRLSWPYVRDVISVCLHQSRAAVRSLVAALIVLVIAGPMPRPIRYIVQASDPAGTFAVEIDRGRAVAATLDGTPVHADDLVQAGDTLVIRRGNHGADFRIAIKPEGGIAWYPRRSVSR